MGKGDEREGNNWESATLLDHGLFSFDVPRTCVLRYPGVYSIYLYLTTTRSKRSSPSLDTLVLLFCVQTRKVGGNSKRDDNEILLHLQHNDRWGRWDGGATRGKVPLATTVV